MEIEEIIEKHTKALTSYTLETGERVTDMDTVVVDVFELKKDIQSLLNKQLDEVGKEIMRNLVCTDYYPTGAIKGETVDDIITKLKATKEEK